MTINASQGNKTSDLDFILTNGYVDQNTDWQLRYYVCRLHFARSWSDLVLNYSIGK